MLRSCALWLFVVELEYFKHEGPTKALSNVFMVSVVVFTSYTVQPPVYGYLPPLDTLSCSCTELMASERKHSVMFLEKKLDVRLK